MKTLSVRQPYAWLIAAGIKDVENRSWSTSHRGALLIHASAAKMTRDDWDYLNEVCAIEGVALPDPNDLPTGAIVGAAWLDDVAESDESPYWDGESLAWIFTHSTLIVPSIPVKGRLGLWEHPAPEGINLTISD